MIHSSNYKPVVIPIYMDSGPAEIDRVQELTKTTTLNKTKIEEVGRDGIVDWKKSIPTINVPLRQLEYGNLDFYRQISNKGSTVNTIEFNDFKTSSIDILGYKTDDSGTFLGTIYYPGLRVSSFGLSIGDPDALIERSFTFVGEDDIALLDNNKYLIYKRGVVSAGNNKTVTLSDPTPVADPDNSGKFLFRVCRSRAGTTTELTHGTEWSYDGAGTLTINGASSANDVIRVWYSAGSYIAGASTFTLNSSDLAGISGDSVSIYLESSNYLYRLQSVSIDSTFDRYDMRELGNSEIVSRGIRDITNRITLGRILEDYTIEEVLRGKAGLDYGKIDVREFADDMNLIIKIYSDSNKTTFKMGYKFTDLSPVSTGAGVPTSDYITQGVTLEGETGFITNVEGVL